MGEGTRKWLLIWAALGNYLMLSCIDQINLPIRQEVARLVVDGSITTELPPYIVRLTYSQSIGYSAGVTDTSSVRNAIVRIQDDKGNSTRLAQVINKPGYYQTTDSLFRGKEGRSYTLTIETEDHKQYKSSPELLVAVPPIDSLSASLKSDLMGFHFSFFSNNKDPASTSNYYRWTARAYHVENWIPCEASPIEPYVWVPVHNLAVNVLSDAAINGNGIRREVIQSPIHSTGPHFVEVKQYSLTQRFYQFLTFFNEQQTRTGSIFDPLPGRISGNISSVDNPSEQALGYFNASAVAVKRIRYYNTNDLFQSNVQSYIVSFSPNCSTEGTFMLKYNPPGF